MLLTLAVVAIIGVLFAFKATYTTSYCAAAAMPGNLCPEMCTTSILNVVIVNDPNAPAFCTYPADLANCQRRRCDLNPGPVHVRPN